MHPRGCPSRLALILPLSEQRVTHPHRVRAPGKPRPAASLQTCHRAALSPWPEQRSRLLSSGFRRLNVSCENAKGSAPSQLLQMRKVAVRHLLLESLERIVEASCEDLNVSPDSHYRCNVALIR